LLRHIVERAVVLAVGTGDDEGGAQGGEEIVGIPLDAETLELYPCGHGQMALATNTHVPHDLGVCA